LQDKKQLIFEVHVRLPKFSGTRAWALTFGQMKEPSGKKLLQKQSPG